MQLAIRQNLRPTGTPIHLVTASEFSSWKKRQAKHAGAWLDATGFSPSPGEWRMIPGADGKLASVLAVVADTLDPWAIAALPAQLPEGEYHLDGKLSAVHAEGLALGWQLSGYSFGRYKAKKAKPRGAVLSLPKSVDVEHVARLARAIFLVRDLINTPAGDMLPSQLAKEANKVAKQYGASCRVIEGKDLLKKNYPLIHAVGRASADAPRLIDIFWEPKASKDKKLPKVTLVGKGVCFDSGGLDIKSAGNMQLMKKDMGGAAHVLGLALAIMDAKLPVQLRVLIPAVENAISGNAFRPMDVIPSRKGLTVEIGNTDAEGRLILADALTEADGQKPDLLIDFATLTGAARVALGTDMPAFFTHDDALAAEIMKEAAEQTDPLWRLPLHKAYARNMKSNVADINSAPDSAYGGAIMAALFLDEFVEKTKSWVHIDLMAWNLGPRPGRPAGGEAMGLRALYSLIARRYSARQSLRKQK